VISAALILEEDVTLSMKMAMCFIFSGLFFVAISGRFRKTSSKITPATK
jgi:hypothetical protein